MKLLPLLAVLARSQVHVMSPASLVARFASSRGGIEGSTATFGAPFYGDRVLGRLHYSAACDLGCGKGGGSGHGYGDGSGSGRGDGSGGGAMRGRRLESCEGYNLTKHEVGSAGKARRPITVALVRRGGCSFATKAKVASVAGAHAVIVVDKEESKLTARDLRGVVVEDDGTGGGVRIPSVLVAKEEGKALIAAAQGSEVIVELAWRVPARRRVHLDFWMSSASRESAKFLGDFAPKRRLLGKVMSFTPHYVVFGANSSAGSLCSDDSGMFCAEDPDGPGPVTGKAVLEEDLRQLCIHKHYKRKNFSPVYFAEEFWSYVEKHPARCGLERFGEECSQQLMREVGVDAKVIADCVRSEGQELLSFEKTHAAWSPRAVRINGWHYRGQLDAELVSRAVCSGFEDLPEECTSARLFPPRDYFEEDRGGDVSFGALLGALCSLLLCAALGMVLYRRALRREMSRGLREEVMLEVQAQLGDYSELQGK